MQTVILLRLMLSTNYINWNGLTNNQVALFDKTIQVFQNKNFDELENLHHEDNIFVYDYSFSNRVGHLAIPNEFILEA